MQLKEFRKKHGYKQSEIAEYLKISNALYSRYEREETKISIEDIKKLATLYRCSINKLIDFDQNPEKEENPNEQRLLVAFRRMNPANQNSLITFAEYSVSQQQKLDQNKQVK